MGAPPGGAPPERPPIPEAEILTRSPAITFDTSKASPGFPIYVTPNDFIFFRVWNSVAGVVARIQLRILSPNGSNMDMARDLTPSSDRVVSSSRFPLSEGWLVSAAAGFEAGLSRVGQVFAQMDILRGSLTGPTGMSLISAYLPTSGRLAMWPGGQAQHSVAGPGILRSITGTDPAANAQISETVPTNARWRLLAMTFELVTDANVANRGVLILVDDGSTTLFAAGGNFNHAASTTRRYNLGPHGVMGNASTSQIMIPIPSDLYLLQGFRLQTTVGNFQAGDDFSAPQLLVEEWIED